MNGSKCVSGILSLSQVVIMYLKRRITGADLIQISTDCHSLHSKFNLKAVTADPMRCASWNNISAYGH